MSEHHSLQTSVTLLGRLRRDPNDQAAWNDFVARYQPKILQWCRGWGLQESDANDVTQAVLLNLNRLVATFAYDHSRSARKRTGAECTRTEPRARLADGTLWTNDASAASTDFDWRGRGVMAARA